MELIVGTKDFCIGCDTAVAIGKFDGPHVGHRRLLDEILEKKKDGLKTCVFTFDPPPSVLFGDGSEKELTTREEKRTFLERIGVDILIEFPLTRENAAISPEAFVEEILVDSINAKFIAAGVDISFGHMGKGNAELLEKMGQKLGFEVKIIEKIKLDNVEVSSTFIRDLVKAGDMKRVEKFLGIPYTVIGTVEKGNQIGRTLGFPTMNIVLPESKALPPFGVYASTVVYKGTEYKAISNVGAKPTVTDKGIIGLESYLYDFDKVAYGEEIEVRLLEFRRPEKHFNSLDELKTQLQTDILQR